MKIDQLLREQNYHLRPDFGTIAQKAARLVSRGESADDAMRAIRAEYGAVEIKTLRQNAAPLAMFGEVGRDFEANTVSQMYDGLKMPVAVKGALMPDGHLGYGLPIGGVVALDNAVWPGGVGYDIACRVSCSIFHPDDFDPSALARHKKSLLKDMRDVSHFGADAPVWRREHPVMNFPLWREDPVLRGLRDKAAVQLGTSGAGNHFVDLMVGTVTRETVYLGLPVGQQFVALVTHSGSRGAGHAYATHYIKVAEQETARKAHGIPKGYAWLDLDTDAGREYWAGMQLIGEYARANHHLIHGAFFRLFAANPLVFFENHHNFAWFEDGLVVHRKGATPAQVGQVGFIPGSVADHAYLVEGLGNTDALNSASHGAGRNFSRKEATARFDAKATEQRLKEWDVLAYGVAKDECPHAYKPMDQVMAQQEGVLVSSFARLQPAIVVMGGLVKSDDGD